MDHNDIMNICRGLPIKKVPQGRRNLDYAGKPIIDVVQTRNRLKRQIHNFDQIFKSKNVQQHIQAKQLKELCEKYNIEPIYKYELRRY
jgi:5'(3')-deoxyribonucleotidase